MTAYLSLGANLGDRQSNLASAVRRLGSTPQIQVVQCSSIYETAPWGFTDQPHFLNCVLCIETTLEPVTLLELVKNVETQLGREQTFRYGPRIIDIDILLYGEQVVDLADPDLQIPHARMTQRAFVLTPLAEIAPNLVHPVTKSSVDEMCRKVDDKESVRLWGPPIRLIETC